MKDTDKPVITAQASVTVEATAPTMTVALGTATATDNVGAVTSNAPASFPLGTTTVTYTAKDAAGNVGTATQTVTVKDAIAPEAVITARPSSAPTS